jgi:hypothetical protein
MAAARQKLMKERAMVEATTTLAGAAATLDGVVTCTLFLAPAHGRRRLSNSPARLAVGLGLESTPAATGRLRPEKTGPPPPEGVRQFQGSIDAGIPRVEYGRGEPALRYNAVFPRSALAALPPCLEQLTR